jgi:hypothetical protein
MRLALSFPPAWKISVAPNNWIAAVLPGTPLPEAVVTYGPIVLKADEPRRWQELVARSDHPPGARVMLGRALDLTTIDGWPLRILEAEVQTAAGELIEVRMCGYFTFLEHASAVIARAQTAAKLQPHAKTILGVLRAGRPDWRGEPACLAQVWDLGASRPRFRTPVAGQRPVDLDALIEATTRTPDDVDSHYDLAQARFSTKDFAGALAGFERVVELDPTDVLVLRKIAQCLYQLGRDDDGDAIRAKLVAAWSASNDPRVRLVSAFVFDQFEVAGRLVMATQTLRPRDPLVHELFAFRSSPDHPSVVVETSDHAKAAKVPYVIGVVQHGRFRGVETLATLPPYAALKRRAIGLLEAPPSLPA